MESLKSITKRRNKKSKIARINKRIDTRLRRDLEEFGFFDLEDQWDKFFQASVGPVLSLLTPIQYLELQEIKSEYSELIKYCAKYLYSDSYDENFFKNRSEELIEEHWSILHDLYIEHDIIGDADPKERLEHLNKANFLFSKRAYRDKAPSFKNYISSALEYFKTKHAYLPEVTSFSRPNAKDLVGENKSKTLRVGDDINGLNNFEIALKHYYLENSRIIEDGITGKQIIEKYGIKKVEVHLNKIRNLKGDCSDRKGFLQNLKNVRAALIKYPEIIKEIDINIDKLT